ncbi:juxtaposed with another zinc finger protein 1 isoform X3 [Pieris brassicae]|uniref:juxtaposed with another zinc finger protein 1 isoform X3 n=1 Tax=Pieris brassicae TaxID=7116 RepID=UPI001E65F62A|nr:juxtaposed with another zinc finger protein 1 isoform X3 [Pieris brassicae]
MAVFMINICKFNGCGITFPRLADLIEHIEDVHIDYDPAVVEQKEASQPSCIPLSYVLKFFTEASRREFQMTPVAEARKRLLSAPKTPSVRSSTPTGSEMDDEEVMSPSEDSNDSWTNVEEYSSEYILQYGVKMNASASSGALGPAAQEKPFACPVPGCKKRYKNVNGIKYHSKNGHKKDGKYPVLPPQEHYKPRVHGQKKRLSAQQYFWKKWGKKGVQMPLRQKLQNGARP